LETKNNDQALKNKHPKLSQHLFWDIDTDQLDWEKNAGFLIGRTLDYGLKSDWKAIMEFYGKEKVKEELVQLRTLNATSISYACILFDLQPQDFRCYRLIQSNPNYWNS
jgi:hypothetical protein